MVIVVCGGVGVGGCGMLRLSVGTPRRTPEKGNRKVTPAQSARVNDTAFVHDDVIG